ncbi:SERTA domain-containing protein 3 [Paramarasmius palmivorus]|uniref:SERTA domain-containing protein 3 n=1 Tax=Paramarasmius palmivorus TaxID=297713 RepID=A0AAW0DPC8_9AGAR
MSEENVEKSSAAQEVASTTTAPAGTLPLTEDSQARSSGGAGVVGSPSGDTSQSATSGTKEPPVERPCASSSLEPSSGASSSPPRDDTVVGDKKRRPGNPGNFCDAREEALQKGLKEYMALSRREKPKFWPGFMARLLEEFPVDKYPIPASRLASFREFEEKSEADVSAMTKNEKTVYRRSLRLKHGTDEEIYLQIVKEWILWQQNCARKADGGATGALFKAELEKKSGRPKPQFNHFVMKHEDYKGRVVDLSKETGRKDRLPARAKAVKDLLASLPEEERAGLTEEYQTMVADLEKMEGDDEEVSPDVAVQRMRRKNFGTLAQEVLNIWRKLTGLNMVLLVGELIDGDSDYDSCIMFSKPAECPEMDKCEGLDFDRFTNTFLSWVKEIYTRTHSGSQVTKLPVDHSDSGTVGKESSVSTGASSEVSPNASIIAEKSLRKAKGRGKKKKPRQRKDEELLSSGDDTPESAVPSDQSSGTESESDEKDVVPRRVPFDTSALWDVGEDGMLVLKKPLWDLTLAERLEYNKELAKAVGSSKPPVRNRGKELEPTVQEDTEESMPLPSRRSARLQLSTVSETPKGPVTTNAVEVIEETMEGAQSSRVIEKTTEESSDANVTRVIHAVTAIDKVPAWGRAVVEGWGSLPAPEIEQWAQFSVSGCSTPFMKEYAGWLLDTKGDARPVSWSATVYKWIEVEEMWNKLELEPEGSRYRLLKNSRPAGFLQWFKYGRMRWEERIPLEVEPNCLGEQWWYWWSKVVNPRWRIGADGMVMPGGEGSWEVMRLPGKDGFVLVLVALRWWHDLLDVAELDVLWNATVKSVYYTLVKLLEDAQELAKDEEPTSASDAGGPGESANVVVVGRKRGKGTSASKGTAGASQPKRRRRG